MLQDNVTLARKKRDKTSEANHGVEVRGGKYASMHMRLLVSVLR